MDRHDTMENYLDTKPSIAKNQMQNETCVLNYDDQLLKQAAKRLKCKTVFLVAKSVIKDGFYL